MDDTTNAKRNECFGTIWMSTILVSSQSYIFGYAFSSLNSCTLVGRSGVSSDCYRTSAAQSGCPTGSIYNDLSMTSSELMSCCCPKNDFYLIFKVMTFSALLIAHVQVATALIVVGAWAGSLFGSSPSELYGRRRALLGNALLFLIGEIIFVIFNCIHCLIHVLSSLSCVSSRIVVVLNINTNILIFFFLTVCCVPHKFNPHTATSIPTHVFP
jgi:hypothetical protein